MRTEAAKVQVAGKQSPKAGSTAQAGGPLRAQRRQVQAELSRQPQYEGPADDWTKAVFRPDLHQQPVMGKSVNGADRAEPQPPSRLHLGPGAAAAPLMASPAAGRATSQQAPGTAVPAGALSLADHLKNEKLRPVAVALDVLAIAGSFLNAGLALKALRSGPAMLVASRGARYLLWSNVAVGGLSGILITAQGVEQIIVVASSDLGPEQKMSALVRVVTNLVLTGALLGISYGEMRSVRGRLHTWLGEAEEELADTRAA